MSLYLRARRWNLFNFPLRVFIAEHEPRWFTPSSFRKVQEIDSPKTKSIIGELQNLNTETEEHWQFYLPNVCSRSPLWRKHNSMELILFIGIQASGKSTFFKERFYDTHVRINFDMLRTKRREEILIDACLRAKQKFVIDKINLTRSEREKHIANAKSFGFKVVGFYFQTNLKNALERNRLREGSARVPDAAILGSNKKLELPNYDEGFETLSYVKIENDGFVVEEWKDEV